MKKIKDIILDFPKFQIQFLIFLLIVIFSVFFIQIFLWAEIQTGYWLIWKSKFTLWKANDFSIINLFLFFLMILFPIIWIFQKKYSMIIYNFLFSLLYFTILIYFISLDWFFNCMDFCWLLTIFFFLIFLVWSTIISMWILFFIKRKYHIK
jgi:hypothetical protein